ncbi:hypothetical protein JNUCC31_00575 [Paenibacillus sp. JNUCC31]|uniref:hypothetical protein n=1 Tax=Paenibacillus sp. JNUCC-31 TaxID=2777983 RepID=UPI001787093E|nr:hypothetical protein [Paenibacillus sp. JNUCC-31]QOS79498.1 hypothetical protein JNUCC31_00575 [Paenibacillus sp. JNUCC-31]
MANNVRYPVELKMKAEQTYRVAGYEHIPIEVVLSPLSRHLKKTSCYHECSSDTVVAEREGIRNCSQLKVWVKKWENGEAFDERKNSVPNPLKVANIALFLF